MQFAQIQPSVPALQVVNGHPTTLSTQVAQYFGKNHQHVTRDIRNLIDKCPDLGVSNFGQTTYKDSQGKSQPCYRMDRKGFVLLAMGFTGEKALQFKIAYIDAFDRMEEELRNSTADKLKAVIPLTPRQQYKIQRAVAERAKGSHVHFNTIYKAIKIYFKVAKYDQIPASRFDECINFIQTVDLRIPEVLSDQPVEFPKPQLPYCPHCVLKPVPKGGVILDQYGAEKLLGFVYEFKYLHRKQLEAFHALLVSVRSPLAGAFYETMNSWAVSNVESLLERNGYSVKDLDCYRHFIGVKA